jgi:hypothetical protein
MLQSNITTKPIHNTVQRPLFDQFCLLKIYIPIEFDYRGTFIRPSLSRFIKFTMSQPNSKGSIVKTRRRPRAIQACSFCRIKKYKCNGGLPCSSCRSI